MTVYSHEDKERSIAGMIRETDPGYCRDQIVVSSGAGIVKANTVMGKITAGGEWVPYAPAAVDGSQNAAGILLYKVDATAADAKAVISARDAVWAVEMLNWGATVTTQPHKDTAIAALKALAGPIIVR